MKLIDRKTTLNASGQAFKSRRRGRLFGIAVAAMLGLASIGLLAAPASASTRLGGVSVAGACQNQWPGYGQVALIANNVYGWKCEFYGTNGNNFYGGVNLSMQCKAQYNNTNAFASYADYNNPYSWSCYG